MTDHCNVAIIGAGIAGLTAAYRLKQAGFKPTVFESSNYVGGRIKSIQRGDFLFDTGAFIYLGSYLESIALAKEVGLEGQIGKYGAYGAMPKNGELKFMNFDTPIRTILTTDYLTTASKIKSLKLFRLLYKYWHHLNYQDATGIAEIDNDTVASYCKRELNEELYQYLASVVVRGAWLTNPEYTSVAQLLWTLKNFFKPYFYGIDSGMDALPRALAEHFQVKLNHSVSNVTEQSNSVDVTYQNENNTEKTARFDNCIITTTADRALALFPQMDLAQKHFYESTDYITSVNTHIGLSKRPSNKATYIMTSPKESSDLSGIIVDHLKAANRAPEGKGQITAFCKHEWCVENFETPDQQVLEKVLTYIKPYYGDLSNNVEDFEIGRWPQVVPIMRQGRFKEIAAYQKTINPNARVQFAGDIEPIGGVNAALVSGERTAKRLIKAFGDLAN